MVVSYYKSFGSGPYVGLGKHFFFLINEIVGEGNAIGQCAHCRLPARGQCNKWQSKEITKGDDVATSELRRLPSSYPSTMLLLLTARCLEDDARE